MLPETAHLIVSRCALQGSGAKVPAAFATAIAKARTVCNAGAALGFDMRTLDIGGGYVSCGEPGGYKNSNAKVASHAVNWQQNLG